MTSTSDAFHPKAHPYLLGLRGASNGSVSIKDYDAFLQAFKRGHIERIVVVERLA